MSDYDTRSSTSVRISSLLLIQRYIELMLLICIVAVYGVAAHDRNATWKNDLSLWKDVVKKSPDRFRGHSNLGNAYTEMGQYDLAKDQFDTALRINPGADKTHNSLGYMYHRMGLLDMAIREYTTALNLDPHNPLFHYNLAAAYNKRGLTNHAIRHYQKAVSLQPDHYKAFYNLGTLYARLGLLDQARMKLKKSLAIKPEQPQALFNLALVFEQLANSKEPGAKPGLTGEAIKTYQRILTIDPAHVQAQDEIGKLRANGE